MEWHGGRRFSRRTICLRLLNAIVKSQGGGNLPKDLRSSRLAVNHSVSKLPGKSSESATGRGNCWPTFGCADGEILEAAGTAGENAQIVERIRTCWWRRRESVRRGMQILECFREHERLNRQETTESRRAGTKQVQRIRRRQLPFMVAAVPPSQTGGHRAGTLQADTDPKTSCEARAF
jgi:hypothetical protein